MNSYTEFTYLDGMLYRKDRAVTKGKKKYPTVYFNGKYTSLHRLIYFHHTGVWPRVVDHIDRDPFNNRIENLRAGNYQLNSLNHKKVIEAKGWWLCKKTGKYVATININSKNSVIGYFKTPEEASEVYKKALEEKWNSI